MEKYAMQIKRAASIPLITHDPYFSIWSSADHLYDQDTVHWCQKRQKIRGYVTVDGAVYCFMGDKEFHQLIQQKSVEVTATSTQYAFENEKIILRVRFTSPLLLDDMNLVSRPCTYVDFEVEKKESCSVEIDVQVSSDLVSQKKEPLVGFEGSRPDFKWAQMGRAAQRPLGGSGDNVTIDWGYVYLASDRPDAVCGYDAENEQLFCHLPAENTETGLIIAYDDLLSINYFGQWRKAYWTKTYKTLADAISAAFADREETLERAKKLDEHIEEEAQKIGGDAYALICDLAYRHTIAAHKLVTDEDGRVLFLSKENDSNGCIGTVDVSYPSVPLYLMYNTEYVKGMLRPVFEFAKSDAWEFDFAPHDVGRFPYAWGQVYGMMGSRHRWSDGDIFPPFYQYPAGSEIYDLRYQMPVEECGNMLIMTAAVCMLDGSAEFAREYMDTLRQWTKYLLEFGADPGEQLCTDDFAGHLSHNANLAVKAIMGIEAYARLAGTLGLDAEAKEYHEKAAEMASDWEKRADAGDHYALVFGRPETWSLKYNLVWDKVFQSGLFSDEVFEKELAYYAAKANRYGTPLDSRRDYTKSDWILWCAAMTENPQQFQALTEPIAVYTQETQTRVPFSDWYETKTGNYCAFIARSVQGGLFMPMLVRSL